MFHGPQEKVAIEITGEASPSGPDGGAGSKALDVGVHGQAPISTEIGALHCDDARPALQTGRLSHNEHRDASVARPDVAPFRARTPIPVASASRRLSSSSLGSFLGSNAVGLSTRKI